MGRLKACQKSASCERIGWQAKAPAPQKRKPLCTKVGQTLSSVNPAISAILSQLLSERPYTTLSRGRSLTLAVPCIPQLWELIGPCRGINISWSLHENPRCAFGVRSRSARSGRRGHVAFQRVSERRGQEGLQFRSDRSVSRKLTAGHVADRRFFRLIRIGGGGGGVGKRGGGGTRGPA